MIHCRYTFGCIVAAVFLLCCQSLWAQPYGVDAVNTLMPASGGMGGTSVARPQDFLSSINANSAALTQYEGTQFTIAGTWAEPTFNLSQTAAIPSLNVGTFSAKSSTPGTLAPNVGVVQPIELMGRPARVGLALISSSGLGTDFTHIPASNGTSSYLLTLQVAPCVAVQLSDRFAVGAGAFLGTAFLDGPFVGQSVMTNDYALRAGVGVSYDLSEENTWGFYWKTRQEYTFSDAYLPPGGGGTAIDVHLGLPEQFGLGIANTSFLDGRLLLAADALFLMWDTAELFDNIYKNQWIMQLGVQYEMNDRMKLRAGYVFAEDPIDDDVGNSVGGVPIPGGVPPVKYVQAQFGVINNHRFTFGCGISEIIPNVELDLLAGGMVNESHHFGAITMVTLESYWIGAGLTWRFGD